MRLLLGVALAPWLLLGCGGSQSLDAGMAERWQWDGGVEASRVLSAVKEDKIVEDVPAAVGVTPRGLVGRALPDGKLWKYEGEVDVLPTLVGDVVLFSGGGKVTMLDVKTGEKRFSVDANQRRLEGAGYDGENAILLLVDKDNAREDQVRVVGAHGASGFSATAVARLGTPAAIDGVGLVPYSGQYIAGFDLKTGELLGRILLRDGLHTVQADSEKMVILGAGASMLTPEVTSNPESQSLKLNPKELPGEPRWPVDGSKPRPKRAQPVGYYAQPVVKEGALQFAQGTYAAAYFEVVLGLYHGSNAVRWSTQFSRAVAGGDAGEHGPTVCLEDGSLWQLSWKDGTQVPAGSLESRVKACVVKAGDGVIKDGDRPALFHQIVETISKTGPDMVAIKKVLLDELGQTSGPATTKALLAIAQDPMVSSDLARQAGRLLSKQEEGGEEMVRALIEAAPQAEPEADPPKQESGDKSAEGAEKDSDVKKTDPEATKPPSDEKSGDDEWGDDDSWDESEDEAAKKESEAAQPAPKKNLPPPVEDNARRRTLRPPPVGDLAIALRRLKTPGAAAALAPFLTEPSLGPADVKDVMITVDALGGPDEIGPVRAFLDNYKNTGGEKKVLEALVIAAQFLFKHLDEEGRVELRAALDQSLTHPVLKKRTKGLEKALQPKEPKEGESEDSEQGKTAKPEASADPKK